MHFGVLRMSKADYDEFAAIYLHSGSMTEALYVRAVDILEAAVQDYLDHRGERPGVVSLGDYVWDRGRCDGWQLIMVPVFNFILMGNHDRDFWKLRLATPSERQEIEQGGKIICTGIYGASTRHMEQVIRLGWLDRARVDALQQVLISRTGFIGYQYRASDENYPHRLLSHAPARLSALRALLTMARGRFDKRRLSRELNDAGRPSQLMMRHVQQVNAALIDCLRTGRWVSSDGRGAFYRSGGDRRLWYGSLPGARDAEAIVEARSVDDRDHIGQLSPMLLCVHGHTSRGGVAERRIGRRVVMSYVNMHPAVSRSVPAPGIVGMSRAATHGSFNWLHCQGGAYVHCYGLGDEAVAHDVELVEAARPGEVTDRVENDTVVQRVALDSPLMRQQQRSAADNDSAARVVCCEPKRWCNIL